MKTTPVGMLVAAAIAILPFITSKHLFYGSVNAKFFFLILLVDIVALVAAYNLYKKREKIELQGRWLLFGLVFTCVVQYIAMFTGVFPERSFWSDIFWSSGVLFLTHLGFLSFFLSQFATERDWSYIRRSLVISAGIFSALLVVGAHGLGLEGRFLWMNLNETGLTFGNETYAGAYLLLAFIIGLIEILRVTEWGKVRVALLGSLLLIGLSPLMSNLQGIATLVEHPAAILGLARASSATMLLVLIFLAGYFLIQRFVPHSLASSVRYGWGGVWVVGALIGLAMLFTPGSFIQQAYIAESSAARPIVWEASLNAIKERPILGWGPENFNYAIERHFDTRLFKDENLAEIWFERAHNIVIDTLVGSGVFGVFTFTLLLVISLVVIVRASRRKLISGDESVLLAVLLFAHLLQMQTAFDTIGSYTLLAIILGYLLWLERGMLPGSGKASVRPAVAVAVLILAGISLITVVIGEYTRQASLTSTFSARTLKAQEENREQSLERLSSFESLRLSSASFIKGSLAVIAEDSTPERRASILAVAHAYELHYQEYLAVQPNHYRAQMNYAYLLLVMTTLGEDRVEDAKQTIVKGYDLSPGNPLTLVLDALAELYRGDLIASQRLLDEAVAINPESEFAHEAKTYFSEQYSTFPSIDVMRLTNL